MGQTVRWMKSVAGVRRDTRGALLIEVLIALAILGVISVVFIGALYTSLHSARIADERSIALTLAKTEIEFAKQQAYSTSAPWNYTVTYTLGEAVYSAGGGSEPSWWPADPDDFTWQSSPDFDRYSVDVSATEDEVGLQRITAVASHDNEPVLTLENYKLDR